MAITVIRRARTAYDSVSAARLALRKVPAIRIRRLGGCQNRGSWFRTTTAGVQPGRAAAGRPGRIHFLPQYGRGAALRLLPGAAPGRGPQHAPGRGLPGGIPRRPGRAGQATARPGAPFAGSGRRADGTELPVEITCSLVPAPAGAADAGILRGALDPRAAAGATTATSGPCGGAVRRRRLPQRRQRRPVPRRRRSPPSYAWYRRAAPRMRRAAAPAAFAGHDDELKAGSLRDPLTALPNGPLFNERLAAALRRPDPVDILLLNLDDFRHLNDVLGRSAADELLVEVASRLRNCVRPHDTVARLGGDEFAVLLTECLNADAVAKRIAEALYAPLRVGGSMVRPGVSMGLASKSAQTLDGAELLRQADAAMTAAKAAGKNTVAAVPAGDAEHRGHKADGETGLRRAVELGQISVHYQPVVSPGHRLGGAVRGVRAVGTARPAGAAQPVPARGGAERPDPRDRRRGPAPRLRRDPALAGRRHRVQRRRERLRPAVPAPATSPRTCSRLPPPPASTRASSRLS